MPSIADEEETRCLLAEQEQSPGPRQPSCTTTSINQVTPGASWNPPENSKSRDESDAYLATGCAERTFFDVCGTVHNRHVASHDANCDESDESDEEVVAQRRRLISGSDHEDEEGKCVRKSIQVVNEILSDIEEKSNFHQQSQVPHQHPAEPEVLRFSGSTSRSLVVDIHVPPEDHIMRPFKHEINRAQRCYSDGSQPSPKRKGIMNKNAASQEATFQPDSIMNIDQIETISETDLGSKPKRDRHSLECSGGLGFDFRNFKFHEEFLNLRQNFFDGRHIFFGSLTDNSSKRKSDSNTSEVPQHGDDAVVNENFQCSGTSAGKGAERKSLRLSSPFSAFPSSALATASVIPANPSSESRDDVKYQGKTAKSSPYTFFTMESDDDFDFNDPEKGIDDFETFEPPEVNFSVDDHKSTISQSSSTLSMPVCRICQLPSMEPNNHLISPCRCLGSIRYVHNNCLLKWLEVSSKRRNGPPCCELCQYQYLRHKKFVISHWRFPECSLKDKFLHFFFIVSVCLMIGCAAVTIICFKEDRGPYRSPNKHHAGDLSPPELVTLSCGVLFFLAFFLAMYVEVKAQHTVYQLICKFFYLNHEWSVEEYDRKRDVVTTKKKKQKTKKKRSQSTTG